MFRTTWNNKRHLIVAPNGMNLSRSMNRPTSRASRLVAYLAKNGPSSKKTIAYDIFGVAIVAKTGEMYTLGNRKDENGRSYVTTGWGTYLWRLLQGHGYITKVRRGRSTVYELTEKGRGVAS